MKMADTNEILAKIEERERVLSACADLYAEIHLFVEAMTSRTYAAYEAARGEPECEALRIKHITAMSIRDDYWRTTRENREDVALMAALRAQALRDHPLKGTDT